MAHEQIIPILTYYNFKPQIQSKVIIRKNNENVGNVTGYDTNALIMYETYIKCNTIKEKEETCKFPENSIIYNSIHPDGTIIIERNC